MESVTRFWSHEAQNIRCVREADFDRVTAEREALQERLNTADELNGSLRDRKNSIVALQATLAKAREWLGDGKYSDGLAREHWTPEYAALVDQVDALLSNKSAPFDIAQLKPVLQWSDDGLCWMDGEENEMASARGVGFKTRTLYLNPNAEAASE